MEESVGAWLAEGEGEEHEAGEAHYGADGEVEGGAVRGYGDVGCAAVYCVCCFDSLLIMISFFRY